MCDKVRIYDRVEEVVIHRVVNVRVLVIVTPRTFFSFALSAIGHHS